LRGAAKRGLSGDESTQTNSLRYLLRLLAGVNAFLRFVNRAVNFVDRFYAKTTFVGRGSLEIALCLPQIIKRGLHVWLIGHGRIEDCAQYALSMMVAAVVSYSLIDEANCVVHVFDRFYSMAAFVCGGSLELTFGLLQVGPRRSHVRLIRKGKSRESANENDNSQDTFSIQHESMYLLRSSVGKLISEAGLEAR
jgi:hypothetical protein